jgi:hypothetical protein
LTGEQVLVGFQRRSDDLLIQYKVVAFVPDESNEYRENSQEGKRKLYTRRARHVVGIQSPKSSKCRVPVSAETTAGDFDVMSSCSRHQHLEATCNRVHFSQRRGVARRKTSREGTERNVLR